MMKNNSGVVLNHNENEKKKSWDFMHYCVIMHWRLPLFLHDSTYAYAAR